jgi:hypothetical protein
MPLSQLKIMFKTSDPASADFVVLTSAMLGYTGKMKLETYPLFEPTLKFNDELRKKIQDLSYKKKIEVFFNVKTFERKITNSPEMNPGKVMEVDDVSNTKTPSKVNQGTIKVNGKGANAKGANAKAETKKVSKFELKAATDRDIADANFEFMIQCIFCTGLPVANYYKTMEFYDPEHTVRKVTLKGTKSFFDFVMPTRFERCFSYLKLNRKVYTVTGLTWINDVLNHPVYVDILTKYKLYKTDVDNVNSEKNDAELENKLNNLFIDIYDFKKIWVSEDEIQRTERERGFYHYTTNNSSSSTQLAAKKMRANLRIIFENVSEHDFLSLKTDSVKTFVEFGAIKKALAKYDKADENIQNHKLKELIIQYFSTIKNTEGLEDLVNAVEKFNTKTAVKLLKNQIKGIVTGYTEDEMRTFVRGTSYESSFMKYFRTLQKLFTKDDMYNIIKNDLNYQDRTPNEIKEMDTLIENELKNYYEYRKSLRDIDSDREISNEHWKKEAQSVNGESDLTLKKEENEPTKSLFEVVAKCKENNGSCVRSNTALTYLEIGLEKINKRDPKIATYEAYIILEVVEGVYNDLNYQSLLCPYMSNVLGDAYEHMNKEENLGENDVMQNRLFLKAQPNNNSAIAEPQEDNQENQNTTTNNNNNKIEPPNRKSAAAAAVKKGGRRTVKKRDYRKKKHCRSTKHFFK